MGRATPYRIGWPGSKLEGDQRWSDHRKWLKLVWGARTRANSDTGLGRRQCRIWGDTIG
jgi:hypothetical protein